LGGTRRAFLTPDDPPDGYKCFRLVVPSGDEWEALARGALASLLDFVNWEQWGDVPIEDCLDYWNTALFDTYRWRRCMEIGTVVLWAGDSTPEHWLPCWGSEYSIEDYPELYAVIGDTFNHPGTPEGSFAVPDMGGNFPVGTFEGYNLGVTGGANSITLTEAQIPAHKHTVNSHDHTIPRTLTALVQIGAGSPVLYPALGTVNTGTASPDTDNTGGGESHDNRPPYLAMHFIILAE
jgi:microcystin-dependent protein